MTDDLLTPDEIIAASRESVNMPEDWCRLQRAKTLKAVADWLLQAYRAEGDGYLRRYIEACAKSIHCPTDLLAGPMLAVSGAAIGRAGRRLKVKDGWKVTSCLWVAGLNSSSGGKTPALNAVENFYEDRQAM